MIQENTENTEENPLRIDFFKVLGLQFRNPRLLLTALTHSSFVNECEGTENNQRLEYLGDSVLGLIVNEYLYKTHPLYPEGDLARIRSYVVSEKSLSKAARKLDLGSCIRMGYGERKSGGASRSSNLADAFEALIGAIYLDAGLEAARKFVLQALQEQIDTGRFPGKVRDAKSNLQEFLQREKHFLPEYEILEQTGPPHQRIFSCRVLLQGREVARGSGNSIKRAEQAAARKAWKILHPG